MATLIINRSDSKCGACGGSADPYEKSHDRTLGYNPGPGCGQLFTEVSSDYAGNEIEAAAKEMRPDLPWVGFFNRPS